MATSMNISNKMRLNTFTLAAKLHSSFVSDYRHLLEVADEETDKCNAAVMSHLQEGQRDFYRNRRAKVRELLTKIESSGTNTSQKLQDRKQALTKAKQDLIDQKIDLDRIKRIRSEFSDRIWSEIDKVKFGARQDDEEVKVVKQQLIKRQDAAIAANVAALRISSPFVSADTFGVHWASRETNQIGLEDANMTNGNVLAWNTSFMNAKNTIIDEENFGHYINGGRVYSLFTMPNYGGRIQVVIDLVANGEVRYVHDRIDMSGWSDPRITHRNEVFFIVLENADARYDFIYDYDHTTDQDEINTIYTAASPGESRQVALISNAYYNAGQIVTLAIGVRNLDYFSANDMWCKTHMWSDWRIRGVEAIAVP